MRKISKLATTAASMLACTVLLTACGTGIGQQSPAENGTDIPQTPHPGKLLTGQDALVGDWRSDAPMVRRKITVDDLPPPYATHSKPFLRVAPRKKIRF